MTRGPLARARRGVDYLSTGPSTARVAIFAGYGRTAARGPGCPSANLNAPLVATAWGRQLQLATANDPRLRQFVQAYRQGPQAPEGGGPCRGGRRRRTGAMNARLDQCIVVGRLAG